MTRLTVLICVWALVLIFPAYLRYVARAQDLQDQEDPGQEGSPEPANSPVDPSEDRQQDQVQ